MATLNERRVAIVTGSGSGIGAAAATLLGERGWAVVVADRDVAGGERVAKALTAAGGEARYVQTDVTDEASVAAMVQTATSAYGRLDGAINSAGVPQAAKPIHALSLAEWDVCSGVNLRGMFLCLKHEVAAMWERGGGSVVAVSSAAAGKGLLNSADYCASKAGVTGLVRGAAIDCSERGIRVNALLPGATETPLALRSAAANPKLAEMLHVPLNRMAQPPEVAAMAVWLLSDEAVYVTGASLAVDGGMSIA